MSTYNPIEAAQFQAAREADPEYRSELAEYERLSSEEWQWFHETGKHMDYYAPERRSRMAVVMEQARKVDRIQVRIARELGFDVDNLGIVGLRDAGKKS